MLAAQGLLSPPPSPVTKEAILPTIRRMGYLQIDTIHAVRRSHHLVLWSRLGNDYDPAWLGNIHAKGHLFEYYAHALCYLPIEDYRIFRGMMLYGNHTSNYWHKWAESHPEVLDHVRNIIAEKGPVSSSDFDSPTVTTGWGSAKAEKLALSRMFATGELMVTCRKNFQRYYDLRERILPDWDDNDALDFESARKTLLLKTISALGIAREDWVAAYYHFPKTGLPEALAELLDEGKLEEGRVNGWDVPFYIHPDQLSLVEKAIKGELTPSHTTLLSPFDPLVSDRERALTLFDFDYTMESFMPAKDRKYGYFCLPILHNGRLVGRLDPKAHRKEKRMEIKNIYLEANVEVSNNLVKALKRTLSNFASWHGMEKLDITAAEPPALREALL
jgi:uncharacterized protein YcaQ